MAAVSPGANSAVRAGLIRGPAAIWVLALIITNAAAMRVTLSPLQEVVKADLHLSDLQMSLVQGLAISLPPAALAIPLGRMVDRSNRVRLLFVLALVWLAGAALTAVAQDFAVLFLARMLAGLGALCALPAAISIAADLSPPERRGRALLLLSMGTYVGSAIAFAGAGMLFGAWTPVGPVKGLAAWRMVHLAFAAGGVVFALPLLFVAEPERREVSQIAPLATALRAVWRLRPWLLPLFVGQVGVVMADTAAGVWAAPILTRSFGLQPAAFAGWMGLVVLIPGAMGSVVGGLLADLGQRRRLFGGVLFGAVAASVLAIPGALFAIAPTVPAFALLLSLFLLCGSIAGLVTAATIAVLTPNEIRGMTLGAFMVVGALIGFGLAPTLVTLVASGLGGEGHLGPALAAVDLLVSLCACLAFFRAAWVVRRPEARTRPAP